MKKHLLSLILFTCSYILSAQVPSYVPANGLVGWWPFNGNANDESGNGNNGTVNGATLSSDRFGVSNKAYSFNGVNNTITTLNQVIPKNQSFTISLWVNPNNVNGLQEFISQNFNPSAFYVGMNGGNLRCGDLWQSTGVLISALNWQHITIVRKLNLDVFVYMNNSLQASLGSDISIGGSNTDPLVFGKQYGGNAEFFNGFLDDVGIWNRALTQQEITNLYTSSVPPTCSVSASASAVCAGSPVTLTASSSTSNISACAGNALPSSLQNGLVGYWPFCGNANDASGNGNNGTVNGATLTTDRFGNANSAYSFDGVDDFINCLSSGPTGNSSLSISVWMQTSQTNYAQFFGYGNNAQSGQDIRLQINPTCSQGSIGFDTYDNLISYNNILSGNWENYVFVYDINNGSTNNSLIIYKNNLPISNICFNQVLTVNSFSGLIPIRLGKYHGNVSQQLAAYFNGSLDDIGIWNRALTSAEIQQLYNQGQTTYSWSPGGATTPSITVTPTSTTTYTCTVNANGQSCSSSQTIELLQPAITTTSNSICSGQSTTLTASMPVNTVCPTLNGTLTNGLAGYWPFCGNANDASGNGNNGTVNGATLTADRFGNANSAYSFDGVNDYIEVTSINFGTGNQHTVSVWVNLSSALNAGFPQHYILDNGTTIGGFYLNTDVNETQFGCNSSYTNLNLGSWYHFTVVRNGNSYGLYINGQFIGNFANCSTQFLTSVSLLIGKSNANTEYANCKIDDIGIWNRALTASEIQQLYTQGQTTYSWSPGGATTPSITVSPSSTTTYTCTVTANGQSCSSSQTITVNPLPTVNAGADQTVCAGTSVTLSGTGANTYTWNNGASNAASFTPTSTTTYSVTGTDANGCINTDQVTVNVNALPTVNAGSDQTICAGNSVTLSGQGANSYSWNNGVNNGVAFTSSATTTYTVTGTNTATGCSNTDQVTVNVNTLPTVNAGADQTICAGTSITLSGSGATTYTWNNNVSNGVAFTPSATATYTVTGTNSTTGCSNTDQVTVNVNALPTVNAGTDQIVCAGTAVTLSGSGATTYTWNNNVSNGIAFTPSATTNYTVTGTNSTTGCSNTDQVTVNVNALPTVNAGVDQTVCAGTAITLSGTGANTYSWNNGVSNGVAFTPSTTGTYTVTGTNSATGCSNTDQVVVNVNALPTVNAGADQTVCAGTAVTISGSGATTYAWNNNVSNGVAFTPSAIATYTVTGTNSTTGCSNTDQVTINVNALPTVNAGVDQTVCAGTAVTLSGSGATTYTWNNNVSNGVAFTPSIITTYTVTGTNSSTGCSNTDQVTINVNALPTVNAGVDQTVCAGTIVTLSGSGATTYTWNNNVSNGVSFTPTATTTYTVTGTNSSTGCTNTDQVTVNVNALPTVNAGSDQTVCAGTAVTLSGSGATTYTWNNNVSNGIAFTPSATTNYTVTGTNSTTGCSNTDQVTVNVNALPTVNAGVDQTVCAGTAVSLSGSGATTYSWNNGIQNSVAFLPLQTNSFVVIGTDAQTGCENSDTVIVAVNALPTVDAGQDLTICKGDTIILSGSGASTYIWNNNVLDGQAFNPTSTQTYVVEGTDNNNCVNTDSITVTVNEQTFSTLTESAIDSYTLNGITYTQSGTYTQTLTNAAGCDSTITLNLTLNFTGIDELGNELIISPNPTQHSIMISAQKEIYSNFSLFDPQGRIVMQGKLQGTNTLVDLSPLSTGNYMLQLESGSKPIKLMKL